MGHNSRVILQYQRVVFVQYSLLASLSERYVNAYIEYMHQLLRYLKPVYEKKYEERTHKYMLYIFRRSSAT